MSASTTIRLPEDFTEYLSEIIMSIYDHEIVKETVELLKGNKNYSLYPSMKFMGKVWWQDEQWHCEVWQFKIYIETISAPALEEIIEEVSNKYGND